MALYTLNRTFRMNELPVDGLRVSSLTYSGGTMNGGHPTGIVIFLTTDQENVDLGLGSFLAAGEPGHGTGLMWSLAADDFENPDGIHFNGVMPFGEEGFLDGRIGVAVMGADWPEATISVQVSTSDVDTRTVDDSNPPEGPPDGILPPTSLTAEYAFDESGAHNVLTWVDQSNNEIGFEIDRLGYNDYGPNDEWGLVGTVIVNQTSWRDYNAGLHPDEIYQYRVRAFKIDKVSTWSNIATTEDQPLVLAPITGGIGGKEQFTITGAFDNNPVIVHQVTFDGDLATDLSLFTEFDEELERNVTKLVGLTPAHDKGIVDVVVTRNLGSENEKVTTLAGAYTYSTGRIYPHIEVSEDQYFQLPLPNTKVVTGTIVGDDDGVFSNPTWLWELISAPTPAAATGISIRNPTESTTAVESIVYAQGTFQFRVTATGTDIGGRDVSITNIAQVIIKASGVPKVQSLNLTTLYPSSIYVDPSVEDDGANGALMFQWTQMGGPAPATISTPNTRGTQISFPAMMGSYSFKLVVSNNAFAGSGIVKIANYSSTPAPPAGNPLTGDMTVTIGGNEY